MAGKSEVLSSTSLEFPPAETSNGEPLKPTWRQFLITWLTTLLLGLVVLFTIYFAWNSTLNNPQSPNLIFATPGHTIIALTVLSHITVLLLQTTMGNVFEAVRWSSAGTRKGISSLNFLILSRATGMLGVLYLLLGSGSGHRLWGLQRYDISVDQAEV
jgi:hypothetical protein